jgi:hypothetical protein
MQRPKEEEQTIQWSKEKMKTIQRMVDKILNEKLKI